MMHRYTFQTLRILIYLQIKIVWLSFNIESFYKNKIKENKGKLETLLQEMKIVINKYFFVPDEILYLGIQNFRYIPVIYVPILILM